MPSQHVSLRLDSNTDERLRAAARRRGQPVSELVRRLIDEGLRMDEHPGIVFRPSVTGRRPALADGPQVWMVARVLRGIKGSEEEVIKQTAKLTGVHPHQVRRVARYYAEYRDEIDEFMRRLDEEAERAEDAWLRQQALLRR